MVIYDTLHYRISKIARTDIEKFEKIRAKILAEEDFDVLDPNVRSLVENEIIYAIDSFDKVREDIAALPDKILNSKKILSLIILPTEKCNFRCVYCYEDFMYGEMSQQTSDSILKMIEYNLPKYEQLNISWFGGEPLLGIDIIENISFKAKEICQKLKKPFFAQITTNGYLLDLETFKRLLKMNIMLFQVTIDGNKVNHDRQRHLANGGETYDVILNNLLRIKEKITTQTIRLIIRVNVSDKITIDEIKRLEMLFHHDKRFVINVQKIFDTNAQHNIAPDERTFRELYDSCAHLSDTRLEAEDTICYAAMKNTLMIRANGDIGKCTVNLNDPKNCIGNINECDFSIFSIGSVVFCNSNIDLEKCIHCCIYPLCLGQQCPARRVQDCKSSLMKYISIIRNYSNKATLINLVD